MRFSRKGNFSCNRSRESPLLVPPCARPSREMNFVEQQNRDFIHNMIYVLIILCIQDEVYASYTILDSVYQT